MPIPLSTISRKTNRSKTTALKEQMNECPEPGTCEVLVLMWDFITCVRGGSTRQIVLLIAAAVRIAVTMELH